MVAARRRRAVDARAARASTLVPVGLTAGEVDELHDVLRRSRRAAGRRRVADEPRRRCRRGADGSPRTADWSLLVRLLGPVEVVDARRTAGGVRAVEDARADRLADAAPRSLDAGRRPHGAVGARRPRRHVRQRRVRGPPGDGPARRAAADGEEWLGRTLTDVLPLHAASSPTSTSSAAGSTRARLQPPELAIETLRPAVELIRDMPFAGTGYLWPDAEGITSNLVLLATSAATELAGHYLSMGDIDGVFWATGQGLKVLPGHEELIALRMRAHARAGDLSGVRLEWESYERVLNADPWSDGEPAPKLRRCCAASCCRPDAGVPARVTAPASAASAGLTFRRRWRRHALLGCRRTRRCAVAERAAAELVAAVRRQPPVEVGPERARCRSG